MCVCVRSSPLDVLVEVLEEGDGGGVKRPVEYNEIVVDGVGVGIAGPAALANVAVGARDRSRHVERSVGDQLRVDVELSGGRGGAKRAHVVIPRVQRKSLRAGEPRADCAALHLHVAGRVVIGPLQRQDHVVARERARAAVEHTREAPVGVHVEPEGDGEVARGKVRARRQLHEARREAQGRTRHTVSIGHEGRIGGRREREAADRVCHAVGELPVERGALALDVLESGDGGARVHERHDLGLRERVVVDAQIVELEGGRLLGRVEPVGVADVAVGARDSRQRDVRVLCDDEAVQVRGAEDALERDAHVCPRVERELAAELRIVVEAAIGGEVQVGFRFAATRAGHHDDELVLAGRGRAAVEECVERVGHEHVDPRRDGEVAVDVVAGRQFDISSGEGKSRVRVAEAVRGEVDVRLAEWHGARHRVGRVVVERPEVVEAVAVAVEVAEVGGRRGRHELARRGVGGRGWRGVCGRARGRHCRCARHRARDVHLLRVLCNAFGLAFETFEQHILLFCLL